MRSLILCAASLLLSGCLSHLPPVKHTHRGIHWAADFDAAMREAARTDRPILACLVAGEVDGFC
ncbi:MAG: hypothetical protein EXR72_06940 [Myxococcales bacterium]|nr:hypothetical protein [Myxococcales bacterium]